MGLNDFWNKIRILIHIGQFNMMFYVHKERWIKLKDQTFYLWSLRWLLSWRHVIFFLCLLSNFGCWFGHFTKSVCHSWSSGCIRWLGLCRNLKLLVDLFDFLVDHGGPVVTFLVNPIFSSNDLALETTSFPRIKPFKSMLLITSCS